MGLSVPEEEWIRKAQRGDREAWGKLYELYVDRVYRYVASKMEAMESEDITEQVFLKAFQSLPSYKWKGVAFSSWLFTIARNLVIDWGRKRYSQRRYLAKEVIPSQPDPQEMAEERALIREMVKAVERLTEAQQEVIRLRFVAGLSLEDTAKIMGKSLGAIKALQHAALDNLRRVLNE